MVPVLPAVSINRMSEGNYDLLYPVLGIIAAVITCYCVVSFARFNARRVALKVFFDLRQAFFHKLQEQGAEFFAEFSIGDMMTRAVADISLIQRLISMGTILLIIMVYATVVGFGFMLYYSPWLTLCCFPMPLVFIYAQYSAKAMGAASAQGTGSSFRFGDAYPGKFVWHSHHTSHGARGERDTAFRRHQPSLMPMSFMSKVVSIQPMSSWMPSLAAICSLTILGYGGSQVLAGTLAIGDFVAFFMFVNMVVQPFRVAGFIVNLFQRAGVASGRLFEVFDRPVEITDAPTAEAPTEITGALRIDNLSYRYPRHRGCHRQSVAGYRPRRKQWQSWGASAAAKRHC